MLPACLAFKFKYNLIFIRSVLPRKTIMHKLKSVARSVTFRNQHQSVF